MQLAQLPDLAIKLEEFKLILDLRTRANPHTLTGHAIINAIEGKKVPNNEILAYVRDQALDSFKTMSSVIGEELTQRVINYSSQKIKS